MTTWIESTNTKQDGTPVTRQIELSSMEDPIWFTDNAYAEVSDDVADLLANNIGHISKLASEPSDPGSYYGDAGKNTTIKIIVADDAFDALTVEQMDVDLLVDNVDVGDWDLNNVGSAHIKNRNTDVDVSRYSGTNLSDKISNAITAEGENERYYIPPINNSGNQWTMGQLTISQNGVELVAPYGTNISHTVAAGNGPVIDVTGGDCLLHGIQLKPAGSEVPDYGFTSSGAENNIHHCFVQDADIGFEMQSGGFKSEFKWCRTWNCNTYGLNFQQVSNCVMRSCYANDCNIGIRLRAATGAVLDSCSSDKFGKYALEIDNCNGYTVDGFTSEVMDAVPSENRFVSIHGVSNGSFNGGMLKEGSNKAMQGFRVSGGHHSFDAMIMDGLSDESFYFVSRKSTGQYGDAHPLIEIGASFKHPSFVDATTLSPLVYVENQPASPTNLLDPDQPAIRHEGETRFHDGQDGNNVNERGPAVAVNGNWKSMIDGGTIA